jgi:hypothetical protein
MPNIGSSHPGRGDDMSIRRVRVGLGVAVFAALSTASLAWATLLTPTLVIGGAGDQAIPSAAPGGAYIAYASNSAGHPNHYDVYVRPAGQSSQKVNPTGSGFAGGIDGNTLIFQHIVNGQSDLNLYDLTTTVISIPSGVNTPNWEWRPSLSGPWTLFGRRNFSVRPSADRIILRNSSGSDTRVLQEQVGTPDRTLSPGQVSGDFATWDRYTPSTGIGSVVRYQISTGIKFVLPVPAGKVQYDSSTNPAGDIFYVRSGTACGKQVVIRENVPGVSDVALAVIPVAGHDIDRTYAVDEGGGVTSLYFDTFSCVTGKGGDIYKLTVS